MISGIIEYQFMIISLQGQRDSRWASKLLGYNTNLPYTIGNYGCLITCFSMYLTAIGKAETPDTVNEKIKALKDGNGNPNGFTGGGNLVWASPERIWGIKCIYQSPYYDGPLTAQGKAKMKALLDENRSLICHVDFDPNDPDDDMHWVLVTDYKDDDFYCNDPWTGQHINVDAYGGSPERAVIEFRAYDPIVTTEGSVMVSVEGKVFENLVRKSTMYDRIINKLDVQDNETVVMLDLDKLIGLEEALVVKDRQIETIKTEMGGYITQLSEKDLELNKLKTEANSLLSQIASLTEAVNTSNMKIDAALATNQGLQKDIQELKQQHVPSFTGWKLKVFNWLLKK